MSLFYDGASEWRQFVWDEIVLIGFGICYGRAIYNFGSLSSKERDIKKKRQVRVAQNFARRAHRVSFSPLRVEIAITSTLLLQERIEKEATPKMAPYPDKGDRGLSIVGISTLIIIFIYSNM